MKATLLIICLLALSCKSRKERNEETLASYPEEVRGHARFFVEQGEKHGIKIKLKGLKIILTDSIGDPQRGINGIYKSAEHAIYLDTTKWLYKTCREELVWHEMGHGVLKRDHVNKIEDGIETSFMNTFPQKSVSEENRWQKIDEMFDCYKR